MKLKVDGLEEAGRAAAGWAGLSGFRYKHKYYVVKSILCDIGSLRKRWVFMCLCYVCFRVDVGVF